MTHADIAATLADIRTSLNHELSYRQYRALVRKLLAVAEAAAKVNARMVIHGEWPIYNELSTALQALADGMAGGLVQQEGKRQ